MGKFTRLAVFYALTFLLLGVIPIVHGTFFPGPMDFSASAARASAETGLSWTSNILVMLRLCVAEPILWLIVFGSAVPSIAALLACARHSKQLRALLARFNLQTTWRFALRDYGLIFMLMLAGLASVLLLRQSLPGPTYQLDLQVVGTGLILSLLSAALLDQGAVLEELGWRGFALHDLQNSGLSPLTAAIIVGIAWGIWHLPRDVTTGVIERLGLSSYVLWYLPSFLAGTITVSIIAAYFVNRANGCIIPAIMIHGLSNDSVGISGKVPMELMLTPFHQATKALPFAVIAIGIILFAGRELGRTRKVI